MKRWIFSFLLMASTAAYSAASYEQKISDEKTFHRLSRTYQKGAFDKIPHVLFLIDRQSKKTYFADSKNFDFHESFAKSLGMGSKDSKEFFHRNYSSNDRAMFVGTLAYHPNKKQYVFEFTEGDVLTAPLLREAYSLLSTVVFAPLFYKPNSLAQDELREQASDVPSLPAADFQTKKSVEVFRPGQATGVLKYVGKNENTDTWPEEAIVIFEQAPIHIAPLRGALIIEPSSPLSHIHMLARAWKIPDARWDKPPYQPLLGQWVTLVVKPGGKIELRKATADETKRNAKKEVKKLAVPKVDLAFRKLSSLAEQRSRDSVRFGAKSANLGELTHVKGIKVPPGFSIPFSYFSEFFEKSGAKEDVTRMLASEAFRASDTAKKEQLAALRARLQKAEVAPELRKLVGERFQREFAGKGVFVRSSTNAEDLPNFNGAGLYTSVPNVKADDQLIEAVKTVWASLWNFEAFKAREAAGMDHFAVYAGVLIQLGVNADSAGVMITVNPFKADDRESIFINAKKGVGIQVVDGKKVPEQILFNAKTGAALTLSRSEEKTYLTFDEAGGLKEVALPPGTGRVLTDDLVKKLVDSARRIRTHFKNVPQDIEWVVTGPDAWIVQSRPYLE